MEITKFSGHLFGLVERQNIAQDIAEAVVYPSGKGAKIVVSAIHSRQSYQYFEIDEAGVETPVDPESDIQLLWDALLTANDGAHQYRWRDLRIRMADAADGEAWFTAEATVPFAKDEAPAFDFSFDSEPTWHPGWEPTADAYLADLDSFPRDPARIPLWHPAHRR
jgi:hypothetical protein